MPEKYYISRDIYRQKEIWRHPVATSAEIKSIITSLQARGAAFRTLSVRERVRLIAALGEKLTEKKDHFAAMIAEEVGRCRRECLAEIDKTIRLIAYYTEIAPRFLTPKPVETEARASFIDYEPLGLILAVMPWNYPLWQPLRFAIPALCAGNACLIKPAPGVGRVTAEFFRLASPELPLDYVLADEEEVGKIIPSVDGVAFTGSVATGRIIAKTAGEHLKKTVLELGGSNAFIVLKDADLEAAARAACNSRFRDAGQSCNAAKRVIVEEAVAEEFLSYLVKATREIRTGDPLDERTTMGPLYLEGAPQKMQAFVDDAREKGAVRLCGGTIPEAPAFYPATLLDRVDPESRVVREEVFGPVLPVLRARDSEAALALANASTFGLGAAIYTRDLERAESLAKRLEVGSVYVNRHTSSHLKLPFGGVKNSGYGRELSEFGLLEFVNIKSYWQGMK